MFLNNMHSRILLLGQNIAEMSRPSRSCINYFLQCYQRPKRSVLKNIYVVLKNKNFIAHLS